MFKRTITYKDLDGNTLTEDFYFHYSTAEATELKTVLGDNMQDRIKALIAAEDAKAVIKIFRGVIADSVGKKSANGKSFLKTDELRDEFMGSDAYSEMLLWLLSDQNNMAQLINGLFPTNFNERVVALAEAHGGNKITVDLPKEEVLAPNLKNLGPAPSIQSPIGSTPRPIAKSFIDMTPEEFAEWKSHQ